MEIYILLATTDRNTSYNIFGKLKDAQEKLKHDFIETLGEDYQDNIDDGFAGLSENFAWITDGPGGSDYDWEIITIDCGEYIKAEKKQQ